MAVGNELRWSDLVLLKEQWEDESDKKNGNKDDDDDNRNQSTTRVRFVKITTQKQLSSDTHLVAESTHFAPDKATHHLTEW